MSETDYLCPHTAFKKRCKKIRHECPKWIMVAGHNPNTGEAINNWDCADKWVPMLLVEGALRSNQTSAEVSKLRAVVERAKPVEPSDMLENHSGDAARFVNGG